MVIRLKKSRAEEPLSPETRFSGWSKPDLYTAMETALSELTHLADALVRCKNDREQTIHVLGLMDAQFRSGQQALASLRRKVVNDKRF